MNLKSPTGIYIHIPFCKQKCSYCDFYSIAKPETSLVSDYIISLCNEITQTNLKYRPDLNSINSIYIGGGTPNILSISQLTKLVSHLEKQFGIDFTKINETTIEINPGLSDYNYLKNLKDLGFNRLSIGVQSLDNKLLKLMRRVHFKEDSLSCIQDSFKAGFDNISCDLIFNYPTQKSESVFSDLKTLLTFPITHLSAYSLSIEPGTILAKQIGNKQLRLGDENKERDTYYKINEILEENKFNHYEISNYSKAGFESQQNNLYWSLGAYFAFGPGSSSFINGIRMDRPANLKDYLDNKPIPKENIHNLTEQELKEEFMFLGLRRLSGICNQDYREIFNSSFFVDFKDAIKHCQRDGLIQLNQNNIRLTQSGIDFADRVALEFLL